jgi:cell division protein FtsQ
VPALKKSRNRKKAAPKRPRRKLLPKEMRAAMRWAVPLAAVIVVAGTAAWTIGSGRAGTFIAAARDGAIAVSAKAGLRVENVLVLGRKRARREDVARALGAERGMAILAFDPFAAKQRLEKLSWVRAATVERRLPDTIYLRLVEREPLALWQVEGKLALIDREGVVITHEHLGRYAELPLIVGDDAAPRAEAILEILRARPVVAEATSATIRVSGRRWDLKLKDGVIVQLPEAGEARAVARLAELIARDRILERDVIAIDMRLPDRLVVRTRPGVRPRSGAEAARDSKTGSKTRAVMPSARRVGKDT